MESAKTPLNPRERVKKSLSHQAPDKIPLDIGGHQTGIHYLTYKKMRQTLELPQTELKIYDWNQQLALLDEDFLQRFHVDTRTLYLANTIKPVSYQADKDSLNGFQGYYDIFGIFWSCIYKPETGERLFYEPMHGPLSEFTRVQQIKEYDWPDPDPQWFQGLKQTAERLYNTTDYALIGRSVGSVFQFAHYLFGMKRFMRLIRTDPELITAAFECILDYAFKFAELYLKAVGPYIETVQISDDLGDQKGPLVNPKMFRSICLPYIKRFVDKIKELTSAKINLHCCGSCSEFIPDLISIGIDCLNPVQISAYDMEPCSLKQRFGDKIVFWGGLCNPQGTLPFGTIQDVKQELKRNINCLSPNGGFIAASIHNVVHDVPPENVIAMFDSVKMN